MADESFNSDARPTMFRASFGIKGFDAVDEKSAKVRYRRLGRSELMVSEISFGTGDNGGLLVVADEADQRAALARALDLGINYFDTSPDYGRGRAEYNIGRALKALGADAIVATKVELMPEDFGQIERAIASSLERSLERLQRSSVDILMIHNPPRWERNLAIRKWTPVTPADLLGPALTGLRRARAAGKVRFFGVACEHAEPSAVRAVVESGEFAAINVWYNMVNPSAGLPAGAALHLGPDHDDYGGIIGDAAANDVGVAVIRPLAGGALTSQVLAAGSAGRHPRAGGYFTTQPELFGPEIRRARDFAFLANGSRTMQEAAYGFVLHNRSVTTVVGGFSDLTQLEELAPCSDTPMLTDEERARIAEVHHHVNA